MDVRIDLNALDLAIFAAYLALTVLLGFLVGGEARKSAAHYFMGDRRLPWYVVATSMVSTVVSTEYFIAQVGGGYSQGLVIAAFSWNAWIVYTLLIWIFLPYYMRTGLYTMPEFLERRYNTASRYIFSAFLCAGYTASIIAGALFAGGVALENMFGMDIRLSILLLGALTGAYTIYGGLKSAAWTDFMQMAVILLGGLLVPVLGLMKVGGLVALIAEYPQKFQVFHPPAHPLFPWTGVFTSFLSVGIWYNCTSQHIVQRCLSARDEWHARMGVVSAGFLHLIAPLLFVVPGIIAFDLFPHLARPDHAYLMLVKSLVPTGLRGLILAAMTAALMSTLSAVVNSTSTLLTLDLYKKLRKPEPTDRQQVHFGRWSGTVILAAGMAIAAYYASLQESFLFVLIQDVFAYIAPPFAVVFSAGILWRRANGAGALATIVLGFPFICLLQFVLFPRLEWLRPYGNYLHRAVISWAFCMVVMIAASLATKAPPLERTQGIIWNLRYARLPKHLQAVYGGWKDFRLWWVVFVSMALAIYGFFLWFRLQH